jgi:hypothetical protein
LLLVVLEVSVAIDESVPFPEDIVVELSAFIVVLSIVSLF